MSKDKTLKDILTPPFECVHGYIGDKKRDLLETLSDEIFLNNKFYKAFLEFTTQALNEKWKRDIEEPKRWIKRDGTWTCRCPKCLQDARDYHTYCPCCGIRLLPPEEKNRWNLQNTDY